MANITVREKGIWYLIIDADGLVFRDSDLGLILFSYIYYDIFSVYHVEKN